MSAYSQYAVTIQAKRIFVLGAIYGAILLFSALAIFALDGDQALAQTEPGGLRNTATEEIAHDVAVTANTTATVSE